MKSCDITELTIKNFQPFGTFANITQPDAEKLGSPPIEFFRDMIQMDIGTSTPLSFSNCLVEQREFVVDVSEIHNQTSEGILPLDNDIFIHVAPATVPDGLFPSDKTKIFMIHQGTFVVVRPGVWHHAPFTVDQKPANVLIVLPERTYINDCVTLELKPEEKISFQPLMKTT